MQSWPWIGYPLLVVGLGVIIPGLATVPAMAKHSHTVWTPQLRLHPGQPAEPRARVSQEQQFTPPSLPDRGAPGRRKGTASRSLTPTGCHSAQVPLTALVPEITQSQPQAASSPMQPVTIVGGLTTRTHPTFWFYVPTDAGALEFILQDAAGATIYQTAMPSTSQAGILSVTLPASGPELQLNQPYQWYFLASCQKEAAQFVQGWIQRVSLDASLTTQLTGLTPEQQASHYVEWGIWYDALTMIGQQYQTESANSALAEHWQQLLGFANLEYLGGASLLPGITQH